MVTTCQIEHVAEGQGGITATPKSDSVQWEAAKFEAALKE